jgi:hypothetical protein
VATLVYAPAIRVHVETEKQGILNISQDITQWELIRRSNAVSSFNFVLQNTDRKYDGMFQPQDRISVRLKRLTWVQVFTGSLNTSPIFSAMPRALPMSASCTLKKLQFWPWDPTTNESINMISSYGQRLQNSSPQGDAGLSGLIIESMNKIANWDKKAIHIGAVPNSWFRWAQDTEQAIDQATSMASILGSGAVIGGTDTFTGLHIKPGVYNNTNITPDAASNLLTIFKIVCRDSMITGQRDQDFAAALAMASAFAASLCDKNNPVFTGVGASAGWYGMNSKWGISDERKDLTWATNAFLNGGGRGTRGLLKIKNWDQVAASDIVYQVLPELRLPNVGGTEDYWFRLYNIMNTVVADLRDQMKQLLNSQSSTYSGNPIWGGGGIPTGTEAPGASGDAFAKTGYDLIKNHPPGFIKYSQGARGTWAGSYKNPNPTLLDCSSFVAWCYYQLTGKNIPNGDIAESEWEGRATEIDHNQARNIRGALLFRRDGDGIMHHVGLSLGNDMEAAAHMAYSDPRLDVTVDNIGDQFNHAALAPGIDYTHAATTPAAARYLTKVTGKVCNVSTYKGIPAIPGQDGGVAGQGQSGVNPFDQLISALFFNTPTPSGDIFGGARQLMNNQPFLPWLGRLTNSTMRAWCSAPNGDFMAWFPDYFNVWGTAAVMKIRPIELQDFTVDWSDQTIVTHEFVLGNINPVFDAGSGTIITGGNADYSQISAMLNTHGIATMDFPQIFRTIYGDKVVNNQKFNTFVGNYLKRFGARPLVEQMPNIPYGPQEFYMALWQFMKHWSEQFTATVPMTFMPELYPGMVMQIEEFGFQAYVTEVSHRGSYGDNGRFTTEAKIIAPAPIDAQDRANLFNVLDI